MLVRPLTRPLVRPLTRRVTDPAFGGWSPRVLFSGGEQGAWYDPSDLSTLFQDSAGTTPVTALGQPVGLMLDKSGRDNHATQATDTARPTIQALVNLLGRSENISLAPWSSYVKGTGVAPVVTDGQLAPDGTLTATRVVVDRGAGNTSSDRSIWRTSGPVVGGVSYTGQAWIKAATPSEVGKTLRFGYETGATGVITIPEEWTLITHTVTATVTGGISFILETRGAQTSDQTVDFLIWHPQVEIGTTPTTYQRVTSATDYADVGAKRYLQFDGVDDFLVTPSIDFTGTDKMTVVAGVRKESDAGQGAVAELTASTAANNGSFLLAAPDGATATYAFDSKGTVQTDAVGSGFTAPLTSVLTGTGDIAGDSAILRVNGTQADADAGDQGTGNYANAALYIGRRGGTSLPLNGRIYSLLVRGALSTQAQIEAAERFANLKTGAY